MTYILVADDHPLFREALRGALTPHFTEAKILEADSLDSMMAVMEQHHEIDLVLLDLNMPGGEYFNGLITLKEAFPGLTAAVSCFTPLPPSSGSVLTSFRSFGGDFPSSLMIGVFAPF